MGFLGWVYRISVTRQPDLLLSPERGGGGGSGSKPLLSLLHMECSVM